MNTSELEEILKKIECSKNTFGGVYPSDLVPNLDTSENQELIKWHFILLMISMVSSLIPMDYLLINTKNIFEDFLNRNAVQWTYNRKHLQSLFTDVCGHYRIFYNKGQRR